MGEGERCCYFKCSEDAAHYYLQICSEEATHYYLQMCSEEAAPIRTSSEGNLWNLSIIKMKNCRF